MIYLIYANTKKIISKKPAIMFSRTLNPLFLDEEISHMISISDKLKNQYHDSLNKFTSKEEEEINFFKKNKEEGQRFSPSNELISILQDIANHSVSMEFAENFSVQMIESNISILKGGKINEENELIRDKFKNIPNFIIDENGVVNTFGITSFFESKEVFNKMLDGKKKTWLTLSDLT